MMRKGSLLLIVAAAGCWAQTAAPGEPPPPEVDRELRARIDAFYQAHVAGKFRAADQMVAEESKDYFFEVEKPRYYSYEIAGISYSESFTRAKATVNCESDYVVAGLSKIRVKLPVVSTWKLIDGQWFWYREAQKTIPSPFGPMTGGAGTPGASQGPVVIPKGPSLDNLAAMVKPDKSETALGPDRRSDQISFTSTMNGTVQLSLHMPEIPGLTAKLEPVDLKPNETAVLKLDYDPVRGNMQGSFLASVDVEPFGQSIPLRIQVTPAPRQRPAVTFPPEQAAAAKDQPKSKSKVTRQKPKATKPRKP